MYHSLSLIQDLQEMKNTREEEEEKLHYNTLNYKMKVRLLLKLCISPTLEPQGGFYRHQGNRGPGDQGTNPGPKRRARRGHSMAARAALRAVRDPVRVLSVPVPGFVFAASDFDRINLLGQWLS